LGNSRDLKITKLAVKEQRFENKQVNYTLFVHDYFFALMRRGDLDFVVFRYGLVGLRTFRLQPIGRFADTYNCNDLNQHVYRFNGSFMQLYNDWAHCMGP